MTAPDIISIDINVRTVNSTDCGVFRNYVRKLGGIKDGKQNGSKNTHK